MKEKSWFYFFLFFFIAALTWTIFGDGMTRVFATALSFGAFLFSAVKLEDACNAMQTH